MLKKPTPSDFRFQNLELFSQQKTMKIHFYIFYKLLTRELTSHILKNTLDGDSGLLKGIYIYIQYIITWWRVEVPPPCDPCIPRLPGLRRQGDQARWPYARSSDLTNWPKASSICRVAGSFIRRCDQNHLEKKWGKFAIISKPGSEGMSGGIPLLRETSSEDAVNCLEEWGDVCILMVPLQVNHHLRNGGSFWMMIVPSISHSGSIKLGYSSTWMVEISYLFGIHVVGNLT